MAIDTIPAKDAQQLILELRPRFQRPWVKPAELIERDKFVLQFEKVLLGVVVYLISNTAESRERAIALDRLEEAGMWAVKAFATRPEKSEES